MPGHYSGFIAQFCADAVKVIIFPLLSALLQEPLPIPSVSSITRLRTCSCQMQTGDTSFLHVCHPDLSFGRCNPYPQGFSRAFPIVVLWLSKVITIEF
jgi:hypothetical protein